MCWPFCVLLSYYLYALGLLVLLVCEQAAYGVSQEQVAAADGNNILVLTPKKRPVALVLREVGGQYQNAGNDAAGYEGKVRTVHAIGFGLLVGAHARNERIVRRGMGTKHEV